MHRRRLLLCLCLTSYYVGLIDIWTLNTTTTTAAITNTTAAVDGTIIIQFNVNIQVRPLYFKSMDLLMFCYIICCHQLMSLYVHGYL